MPLTLVKPKLKAKTVQKISSKKLFISTKNGVQSVKAKSSSSTSNINSIELSSKPIASPSSMKANTTLSLKSKSKLTSVIKSSSTRSMTKPTNKHPCKAFKSAPKSLPKSSRASPTNELDATVLLLAGLRKNKTKKSFSDLVQTIKEEVLKRQQKEEKQQKLLELKQLKLIELKLSKKRKRSNTKKSSTLRNRKGIKKDVIPRKKRVLPIWERAGFEGYSDDEGSVDSGVLDENVCFECGETTHREIEWETLILCDHCDGEYHLKCCRLDLHPRNNKFKCSRCLTDENHFSALDFSIDDRFQISQLKKGEEKPGMCYSPSRPLDLAWSECIDKGFMVISRLFNYEVMKVLTHGTLERVTQKGRVAEVWKGATAEFSKKSQELTANVVNRGGRYDMKIPDFVVESLQLGSILEPVLDRLRSIMGTPVPQIRTHNLVFVPVGTAPQAWHCDDTLQSKTHRYFTILIHLNPIDSMCGGTELWVKSMSRGDMIRGRPGDAFVFNGSLLHRGQANMGRSHRLFYYASFACRNDTNADEQ